ncbi:MAG: helix-turn-helix domain-containing protein [Planctomycetota bacterium]|nr:helix-turn-helix domain-containing protein [Planctomycetota bacterium]
MKTYGQICGIAQALDMIGDRWTLLILRELLLGPLRYGQLLQNLEGITTNLLADRLVHLSDSELVEKSGEDRLSTYRLTERGNTIEPVLFALGAWGWQFLDLKDKSKRRSLRWGLVSLKRRLKSSGRDYTIVFDTPDSGSFVAWEKDNVVGVGAMQAPGPDLVLHGPSLLLLKAVVERHPKPWDLKGIEVSGKRPLWTNFLTSSS